MVDDTLTVPLGTLALDQPRHLVLELKPDAPPVTVSPNPNPNPNPNPRPNPNVNPNPNLNPKPKPKPDPDPSQVSLVLHGRVLCEASSDELQRAPAREIVLQQMRLAAVEALEAAAGGAGAAPLTSFLAQLEASPFKEDAFLQALQASLRDEAVLGCSDDSFPKWGRHYLRCLPMMLRAERKSNFRDGCLEAFGRDAQARQDAIF